MSRLGVVMNARSWRNRGETAPIAGDDILVEAPASPEAYPDAMRRFAAGGVTTIVVDGGDGTLRDVMSAMIPVFGAGLPSLALRPSGKTNVAAADVGGIGREPEALARLAAAVRSGAAQREAAVRRPIGVSTGGRVRYGFVFGFGAYERAVRLVNERVHSRGFAQGLGVAFGVALAGASALAGKERAVWRRGAAISVALDGGPAASRDSFVFMAASLERLMLGLWPFWGQGAGAIRFTDVEAPPRRLARGLATAGLGRPRPWAEAEGWRSGRADRIALGLHDPFIFDGDTFHPQDGAVELTAGPPIAFVKA
jgi:hypothetical protein